MENIEEAILGNHEMLYKIAIKYLKNHDDVLDVLQETAYKAIKNSNSLKEEDYVLTWIIRILINNCLQVLKKKKYFSAIKFDESSYYASTTDLGSDIEVTELLLTIKATYRDVIILKYIEGYKIKEIAKIYKKPESTIKTWLRRGLKALESEVCFE